jgi:hypothetical protein
MPLLLPLFLPPTEFFALNLSLVSKVLLSRDGLLGLTINNTLRDEPTLHKLMDIPSLIPHSIHHRTQQLIFSHTSRRPPTHLFQNETFENDAGAGTPRRTHGIFLHLHEMYEIADGLAEGIVDGDIIKCLFNHHINTSSHVEEKGDNIPAVDSQALVYHPEEDAVATLSTILDVGSYRYLV